MNASKSFGRPSTPDAGYAAWEVLMHEPPTLLSSPVFNGAWGLMAAGWVALVVRGLGPQGDFAKPFLEMVVFGTPLLAALVLMPVVRVTLLAAQRRSERRYAELDAENERRGDGL